MTYQTASQATAPAAAPFAPEAALPRKPRLALMGEFSAGKSTLTNLLVGRQPLPTRVTATRLPPVWISHGAEGARLVGTDGSEAPVPLEDLASVPLETTALIRLSLPAEALELCDLIDMPGISDPNMPASVWQNLLPEVDSVIWCTHATQAWRQSEAAAWEEIAARLDAPSTLLITHFDKLKTPRDRDRVLRRVQKETGDAFNAIFPLSLSQALSAGEDMEAWKTSGADGFIEYLVDLLLNWSQPGRGSTAARDRAAAQPLQPDQALRAEVLDIAAPRGSSAQPPVPAEAEGGPRVTPRRVSAASRRSPRPDRLPPEAPFDSE
ncbi:dynamin family protein [Leisingera aquaemixtae]|uniref:dynamin family protein n=1 Tax=Leisingera aquaemixtae TaxID=1396826 RepID=UPI001C9868DC|nr:dynamin family protein [Leisingera aquaemixtae]MBY6068937.1 dynamin family protein [Leisingera aquaemixtae]